MKEKFSAESTNLDQPSGNKNGAPNEASDSVKECESESLDTERSSSPEGYKDKSSLSSFAGRATGPCTPTPLPRKPGENTAPSGPPQNLPISGLYAEVARQALPEELRIELHLAEGATYGDALAMVLFGVAIKGSIPAAREIRESIEGKASQRSNPVAAKGFEVLVRYEQPPLSKMMSKDNPDVSHDE